MKHIEHAIRVFEIEAKAVEALKEKLDDDFSKACDVILKAKGKIIVTGMGKSGIVGKKIAATLASTGTSSFFMHPGEAYHGDLGMIKSEDILLAISNSGETDELIKLIPFIKSSGNILISMTGNPESVLAKASRYHLNISVAEEACPLKLAPTASTTATLAMGDALAIALMEARGFNSEDFARYHPGGTLGRRLLLNIEDEMVTDNLPIINSDASLMDILHAVTNGSLGLAIVSTGNGFGVITDGDIRRLIEVKGKSSFEVSAEDIMSINPIKLPIGTSVGFALDYMEEKQVTRILVEQDDKIIGVFKK